MENSNIHDLIEAYLDGKLPAEKRHEVEKRMAEDERFRRKVKLQRELQEHFEDPQRWHLRNLMAEIMAEELPPEEPPAASGRGNGLRRWWLWMIPFALLVGAGVWFLRSTLFVKASQEGANELPSIELQLSPSEEATAPEAELSPESMDADPAALPSEPQTPLQATRPPIAARPSPALQPQMPIAQADPADFVPNPSMEMLVLSGSTRSGGYTFFFRTPSVRTDFARSRDGTTQIRFEGEVEGMSDEQELAFSIAILSTTNISRSLLSIPVTQAKGGAAFELQQKVNLRPGLYYFVVTLDGGESDAYYGKFTIGKEE